MFLVDVGLPLAVDGDGRLAEQVEDDGDVVGGQVPRHVDVLLEEPEVEAPGADVLDLADVAGFHDLLDAVDGGGVDEGVPHHQGQLLLRGELDQLVPLLRGLGHRLLDEGVLPRLEALLRQLVVQVDRGGDDHGVHFLVADDLFEILRGLDLGVQLLHVGQPLLVLVADVPDEALRQGAEVPDEVRTPVPASHDGDLDFLRHVRPPVGFVPGVRLIVFPASCSISRNTAGNTSPIAAPPRSARRRGASFPRSRPWPA